MPIRSFSDKDTEEFFITGVFSVRVTRMPTTPGEILREEFLRPLQMTQGQLADHIGCDVKVINRIVNGRSSVTAEVAIKLAATFRTTPQFWLNAQQAVNIYRARRNLKKVPKPVSMTG